MEPKRVVPSYAVPVADLRVAPQPAPPGPAPDHRPVGFGEGGPPLLDPSVPFAVHTADGEPVRFRAGRARRRRLPASRDPDLADLVVPRLRHFDWWEEDEPIVGHPRDPFHRIDVRRSLAPRPDLARGHRCWPRAARPHLLFEGAFPLPRYYLPREDLAVRLLPSSAPHDLRLQGSLHPLRRRAARAGVLDAIAWSYEEPLDDARTSPGWSSFYQERLDLELDGEPVPRVRTPWSR